MTVTLTLLLWETPLMYGTVRYGTELVHYFLARHPSNDCAAAAHARTTHSLADVGAFSVVCTVQ